MQSSHFQKVNTVSGDLLPFVEWMLLQPTKEVSCTGFTNGIYGDFHVGKLICIGNRCVRSKVHYSVTWSRAIVYFPFTEKEKRLTSFHYKIEELLLQKEDNDEQMSLTMVTGTDPSKYMRVVDAAASSLHSF
ncbi:hypothetical protein L6452_18872 [Arctium lappa]|uniref:Uncharacterized protein n=1 Tax=Arctium lappa TaxID=4217 RepID=A0ACB9C7G7_ARCLA|nr:hypothetical protein L6452_18872 [Arctium lappa]